MAGLNAWITSIVFHAAGLHGSCRIISNTRKDAICIDRSKKMLPSADPSSFLCLVRALTRVTFLEGDVKLLDQSSNDWLTEYLPLPKHTSFAGLPAFGGVTRPEDFQAALKGKGSRKNPAASAEALQGLADVSPIQEKQKRQYTSLRFMPLIR